MFHVAKKNHFNLILIIKLKKKQKKKNSPNPAIER